MADDYVCTLDESSIQKAKDELSEDPKERMSHVETFRKWVQEQPHLTCPTDTYFLLRFLRQGKFSQLRARKTLEGFLKMKSDLPQWFDNVDLTHPDAVKFIKTGYFLIMPKRDKEGRLVCITREGCFEASSKVFNAKVVIQTIFALFMHLSTEEMTMVNGIVCLSDFGMFSLKHELFWGMDNMKKMTNCWQNNMPGRFKGFHVYNMNPVVEALMSVILPLMSKKFQERTFLHGNNLEHVYKHFPMENLPREYLPDDYDGPNAGTIEELTENLLKIFEDPEVRQRLRYESDPKWGLNKKMKLDMPNESFRKLNVD